MREGVLLSEDLDVTLEHSFSALPSDTEFYVQKHFGVKNLSQLDGKDADFEFKKFHKPENLESYYPSDDRVVIWSRLPDNILHEQKEGFEVSDLMRIYEKTKEMLESILRSLSENFSTIYVTSDHGYVTDAFAWEGLRDFPSDKRYAVTVPERLKERCRRVNEYWLLLGRYNAVKRGKHSHIRHGGLSFLEVITPFFEL